MNKEKEMIHKFLIFFDVAENEDQKQVILYLSYEFIHKNVYFLLDHNNNDDPELYS